MDNDVPITYRELNIRINRLSNSVLKIGLSKGDRIAVLLHNCREFMELFYLKKRPSTTS